MQPKLQLKITARRYYRRVSRVPEKWPLLGRDGQKRRKQSERPINRERRNDGHESRNPITTEFPALSHVLYRTDQHG